MKNNWKGWLILIVGVLAGFFMLIFVTSVSYIGYEVERNCQLAQAEYGTDDCVDGLIEVMQDESKSLKERNHAIWSLGQMGDSKALPALKDNYQGPDYKCDHENEICQYEIEKAINLIESDFNITAYFWRR